MSKHISAVLLGELQTTYKQLPNLQKMGSPEEISQKNDLAITRKGKKQLSLIFHFRRHV